LKIYLNLFVILVVLFIVIRSVLLVRLETDLQHNGSGDNLNVGGNIMNIFVGNLSFETTDEELRAEFAQYGELSSVNILRDRMTNRSRGFAFVEMPNNEEAQNAITALNGKTINGRQINAAEARPREERPARPRTQGGGFGGNRNRSW
jgi:RNA recognition motif-containing protein